MPHPTQARIADHALIGVAIVWSGRMVGFLAVGTGTTSPRMEARLTVWEVVSGRVLWSAVEPGAYLTSGLTFATRLYSALANGVRMRA